MTHSRHGQIIAARDTLQAAETAYHLRLSLYVGAEPLGNADRPDTSTTARITSEALQQLTSLRETKEAAQRALDEALDAQHDRDRPGRR
jgi:hypothetical protein